MKIYPSKTDIKFFEGNIKRIIQRKVSLKRKLKISRKFNLVEDEVEEYLERSGVEASVGIYVTSHGIIVNIHSSTHPFSLESRPLVISIPYEDIPNTTIT